jgi:hypothetical protein
MPTQKDLKRLVRARMKKTGESYTAARARLVEKRPPPRRAALRAVPKPAVDLAALGGMSDDTLAKKTGHAWKEWVRLLDAAGAAKRSHTEIARILREDRGLPGWWSQMVAVGYERIRGLRERGQNRDGTFAVGKSKVYPVPLAELWKGFLRCKEWLDGEKLRMSTAKKHKVMRMRWSDGTPVEATFFAKGATKSQVHIEHRKLASRAEAERMRAFWGACLVRLGALMRTPERAKQRVVKARR